MFRGAKQKTVSVVKTLRSTVLILIFAVTACVIVVDPNYKVRVGQVFYLENRPEPNTTVQQIKDVGKGAFSAMMLALKAKKLRGGL